LGLIEWIAKIEDSEILEKIKSIQTAYIETHDWWDDISQQDKDSIKRGIIDFEEGRIQSHESAKKSYEKYL
jgi:predicted transcriptional regulator